LADNTQSNEMRELHGAFDASPPSGSPTDAEIVIFGDI
jgi:hypothetical protein